MRRAYTVQRAYPVRRAYPMRRAYLVHRTFPVHRAHSKMHCVFTPSAPRLLSAPRAL